MARFLRQGLTLAAATVATEVLYARNRRVPSFTGLDPSGTFGDPALPRLRLLILGDSTVTGPGLDDVDAGWPRAVARHLSDRYRVELTSLAVGGSRSRDVLEHQLPEALLDRWDVTIVSVGSNDVLHLVPVWRFLRRLDSIIERLVDVSDEVILFGVGDLGTIPRLAFPLNKIASAAGHMADWVHARVARRHGVGKIDQWKLTTAAFRSGLHMFSPDLFHPSPAGHAAWADAVIPAVEEAVSRLEQRRGQGAKSQPANLEAGTPPTPAAS